MNPIYQDETGGWWHVGDGSGMEDQGPFDTEAAARDGYNRLIALNPHPMHGHPGA